MSFIIEYFLIIVYKTFLYFQFVLETLYIINDEEKMLLAVNSQKVYGFSSIV